MAELSVTTAVNNGKSRLYILVMIILIVMISWFNILDDISTDYVDKAIVQSTMTFGVARALNAAISVAQSIQVGIFGSSITIGEMLDPVNDLIEQFSTLMKYSISSLIIQKLLIELVSKTFFKILISISGVFLFIALFLQNEKYFRPAMKTFVFMAFLRYIVVLSISMNAVVDYTFIREKFDTNIEYLQSVKQDATSVGDLSESAKILEEILQNDLKKIEDSHTDALSRKEVLLERIRIVENEIAEIKQKISDRKGEIGIVKVMNFLSKDDMLNSLNENLSLKESALEEFLSEKKEVEKKMADIEDDIEKINDRLSGKSNGLLEKLKSITSNISSKMEALKRKMKELGQRMNEAIPVILNLMALFTLRVLILPLLFLYLFQKGFKLIWNVELSEVVKMGSRDVNSSEKSGN